MNFFDWTQDSTIPVTKDISLLTAGFDNRNAELVWNEYYDLNPYSTSGDLISQSNSSFNSPHSSTANTFISHSDGSTLDDYARRGSGTSSGSFPLASTRDPLVNRIQRRRTQNRNSQRIYRQRRVEERQKFEERAVVAEAETDKLRNQIKELQSEIVTLEGRVDQLEAENIALRSSTSAMPWRKC